MKDDVLVNYSEYGSSPVAREIEFELIKDVSLRLEHDACGNCVVMRMSDKISDSTELEGRLDYAKLNVLIRALSLLRNQMKAGMGPGMD